MPAMAASRPESEPLNIQLLVDSIPALIHTSRPDGYLDYFNKPWLEYLGVTLDKVAGWNWTAFIHPEDVEGIVAKWRACLASGEIFEYETRVRRADGEYRWMFHRKVPLRDERGNIVKWYGSSLDIEERKTTEEQLRRNTHALQRSEFYLAEGQRLGHMGSWAFDPDGFDYWSPELFRMHGLDPAGKAPSVQEYLGFVHPQDRRFHGRSDQPTGGGRYALRRHQAHRAARWRGPLHSLRRCSFCRQPEPQKVRWQRHRRHRARAPDPGATAARSLLGGSPKAQPHRAVGRGTVRRATLVLVGRDAFAFMAFDPTGPPPHSGSIPQRIHPHDARAQIEHRAKTGIRARRSGRTRHGDFESFFQHGR